MTRMAGQLPCKPGRTRRHRRRTKSGLCTRTCSQDNSVIALRQWMKLSNFKSSLQPAIFEDTGRGLMAGHIIEPGEVLVAVPHTLLITTQTVLQSDIGDRIKSWEPLLTPQQAMTIFLIWEKYKYTLSPWHSYLLVAPETFTTPGYFSETELSLLPKAAHDKATVECLRLKTAYELILFHSEKTWSTFHKLLSYETFLWAWYVINTRSVFYVSPPCRHLSQAVVDNIALAPFLDLLNHSPHANTEAGYNPATNCYEIRTGDHYKRYNQVFISYGAHDNVRLFIEYGFCVPNNPHDVYEFHYDDIEVVILESKVTDKVRKLQVLRENKLLKALSASTDGLSWKLWTCLKTLAMSWQELQSWPQIYTKDKISESTVSIATKMARFLIHKALDGNQERKDHFKKVTHEQPLLNQDHVNIARTLLDIQSTILSISLHSL